MSDEIEFVDGLIVKAPNERAPDFVKAQISIKVADLGQWLREKYKAGDEWINLDVKEAKSGKWYAAVSTFKPKKQEETKPAQSRQGATRNNRDDDQDIPFAPVHRHAV
jgi:hypothetical protein